MGETHHTSVILEVEVDTVGTSPRLALSDNHRRHDLLSELRLSLLHGSDDHVTSTGSGETVETSTGSNDSDDVDVTGTGVVAAVDHGSTSSSISISIRNYFPGRVVHRFDVWSACSRGHQEAKRTLEDRESS